MGYYRWPEPCRDWSSLAPAPAPIADAGLANNSQWRITGRVHYLDYYIAGRKQLIAFYKQLAGAYPKAERQ